MSYIIRSVEKSIRYLLGNFPIVAIIGARQVGKSTLLHKIWPDVAHFDLEDARDFDRIEADVEFFLTEHPPPITLDEAQLSRHLFNGLRVAVDRKRNHNGQYLLSGSSSPQLLRNISESLAGRIAIYELGGLTFEDAYELQPSPLYKFLIEGDFEALGNLKPRYSREQLLNLCYFGAYPEHFLKRANPVFHDQWLENYIRTYIDRDIRALFPNLKLDVYRRFIRMLAVSSGQQINASQFGKSLDTSSPTIKRYFEIAEGTFLWRSLPSYHSNQRKRVVKMPKGHFRDTGLLCRLLNILSVENLLNHPALGHIWESYIIEQLINGLKLQLRGFNYYYYRTQHHVEVDLVLQGAFGLVPVEIKTGYRTLPKQLRALKNFVDDHQCPAGFVINNAEEVQRLSDKIIQLPASCL